MYPRYYAGEQLIGNRTEQLVSFIKTHSQDSLVIQQLNTSERLSKIYPKIYGYSSLTAGIGGLGLGYVVFKSIFNVVGLRKEDPALDTVTTTSLRILTVGGAGIAVAGGYSLASRINLRRAMKGYNKTFQTDKVVLDFQPYVQSNVAGLAIKISF